MIRHSLSTVAALFGAVPAAIWIQHHERIIRRRGRPLRPRELRFARDLGIRHPGAVRLAVVPRVPAPLAGLLAPLENTLGFSLGHAAGVTLGYGIYIAEKQLTAGLIAHELVHVRQYETLGGPLPFIRRYFYECLLLGYPNSPLEMEARQLSRGVV